MKSKLTILGAILALSFIASDATTTRPKSRIQVVYQEQENGDYRLYVFASDRSLICEEKPVTVLAQPDAVSPLVIECKH